ncbi:hypothetical protein AB1Y20_018371 [Prymnesium parvum]|uniref:Seipin n=1 Tax=Prymnesium parvum TaxID=97485 RepID=A0AB34JNN2_PRYPA
MAGSAVGGSASLLSATWGGGLNLISTLVHSSTALLASVVYGASAFLSSAVASALEYLWLLGSSCVYATVAFAWLSTSRLRASSLSSLNLVLAITLHATFQLVSSFVLSLLLYYALYSALVPDEERSHEVHFSTCASPFAASRAADRRAWAPELDLGYRTLRLEEEDVHSPRRHAELWFDVDDGSVAPAFAERSGKLPVLAPGWVHSAHVCLTLPESPANLALGTFRIGLKLMSTQNATLLSDSRAMLVHYKSPLLHSLWVAAYAVPLLLGLVEEAQTHCLELAPHISVSRKEPVQRVQMWITPCEVQVYHAVLYFRTRLLGVSYLMRRWFFTSSVFGVAVLMLFHWLALLLFDLRIHIAPTPDTEGRTIGQKKQDLSLGQICFVQMPAVSTQYEVNVPGQQKRAVSRSRAPKNDPPVR